MKSKKFWIIYRKITIRKGGENEKVIFAVYGNLTEFNGGSCSKLCLISGQVLQVKKNNLLYR